MEIKNTAEFQDCISIHNELNQLVRTYYSGTYLRKPGDKEKINSLFEALYTKNLEENYLWQYCPTKVFKFYFEQRLEQFLAKEIDITLKDFFINELNNIFGNTQRRYRIIKTDNSESSKLVDDNNPLSLPDKNEKYYYKVDPSNGKEEMLIRADFLNQYTITIIEASQNKKISYLFNKYDEMINPAEVPSTIEAMVPVIPEVNLDYSDNTAAEKIVFLHQLGIIEFLKTKPPFNTSTNKLAEVISAFTGIPRTTAQSYINPIISKEVVDKNNPLTEKNTAAVMQKLLKMGYLK